ncbi:hypothetical protein L596_013552 [Steinernema carpocapsae]|uniref:Uncharacterized protein n=1 Tax=Steinernema carpocapsae TaxID=34508 RepID=A0A4U5P0M8_STECR|nr:hypothetical protein L596_013552 [Steinernema carpocapsae]
MVEIPCPPRCACGGAYRNYEDPNTEAPADHRRRDSDTTIDELLASEDSEFQRIVEFQTLPSVNLLDLGFEGSPPSSSIPKPFQNGSLNKMIPAFDHDKSRSSSGSTPRESINGHPANPEQIVSNCLTTHVAYQV